jgi:hypothetical protein
MIKIEKFIANSNVAKDKINKVNEKRIKLFSKTLKHIKRKYIINQKSSVNSKRTIKL